MTQNQKSVNNFPKSITKRGSNICEQSTTVKETKRNTEELQETQYFLVLKDREKSKQKNMQNKVQKNTNLATGNLE